MNYYEHHIGDYLKKTAHLSMLEEGAYRRLLDVYYTNEKPLPGNLKDCCKLARAQSKPEREAVAYVLGEFFQLESDGYHQTRCDDEIGAYQDKAPEAEQKRENDRERQRRARERRKALFEELRSHGVVAPWNAKTSWLETELSRVTTTTSHAPVTRDNTATQSPDPSNNPHNPQTADGDKPSPKPKKPRKPRQPTTLINEFLDGCKQRGETPIPIDHAVFKYAEKAKLPREFLRLAWREFVERHQDTEKRYRDWRKAFSNCIRGNWYSLWWFDHAASAYTLTTKGVQARNAHQDKAA